MTLCSRLDYLWVSKKKRWVALFAALIDNFAFGSYFYGYNALVLPYAQLGVFGTYCTNLDCAERQNMFNYAYIAGLISQLCLAPLTGLMMDHVGLRITKLVSMSLICLGSLLFAFTNANTSFMIFPAMTFVSVGSFGSLFCNYHIGSMFHRVQGLVLSLISGVFDSSSAMAFFVGRSVPWISLQNSFIIIAVSALAYGTMMSLVFITETEKGMIPIKMIAIDALNPPESESDADEEGYKDTDELINTRQQINRIINQRFPNLSKCIRSLPFLLAVLVYTPGILRFTYLATQLDMQLNYTFPNDYATINALKDASAAISMCGLLISPITGFTLDMSRRTFTNRLMRQLNDPVKNLTDDEIYWAHIRSLVPAFTLHASLAVIISGGLFIKGQVWIFYLLFIVNMIFTSVLSAGVTAAVMNAFPVVHFGTIMGLVTCAGGMFSTVQYGLLLLPIHIGNGILVALSIFLFVPPLIMLIKKR